MTVQQMARLGGLAGGRSRSKAKLAAARRNIRKALAARRKQSKRRG